MSTQDESSDCAKVVMLLWRMAKMFKAETPAEKAVYDDAMKALMAVKGRALPAAGGDGS